MTRLIAEIHIGFLRLLLRDDEDEQITLTAQDTNNSFNIMMQLLEPMTYAEVSFRVHNFKNALGLAPVCWKRFEFLSRSPERATEHELSIRRNAKEDFGAAMAMRAFSLLIYV